MYLVTITNPNSSLGAKCRNVSCTHREDAIEKFCQWERWLDARRDMDLCRGETLVSVGDDGYVLMLQFINATPPKIEPELEEQQIMKATKKAAVQFMMQVAPPLPGEPFETPENMKDMGLVLCPKCGNLQNVERVYCKRCDYFMKDI